MAATYPNLGQLDAALATGRRALEIAGRLGDLRLRIVTTSFLEQVHFLRGELERVVELATGNLAALPANWTYEYFGMNAPPSVWDRCFLIACLANLGRFSEAAEHEAEAIRLAELMQHAYTVCYAYQYASNLYLMKGHWERARSLTDRLITVARTGGILSQLPAAIARSAWVLAQLGEANASLDRLQEGVHLVERRRAIPPTPLYYLGLGHAYLLLGRLDDARRLADRADETSRGYPLFAPYALHLLGTIATHPDAFDAEKAEASYRKALALAEPRRMRPAAALSYLGLGKLCRRTDRREQALGHLTTATTMFGEMDMRFWLEQADAELRGLDAGG
jgi:tetratricopeptide (TPR) repeat protein